ncbi:MAG: DNA topoisomerase [Candidatus Poseidoniaceae archaeon]|jgi:DNA topoisomerase-3|nr:DNA topoisomerase [Candidatus Poseidoniaceae archaeon]
MPAVIIAEKSSVAGDIAKVLGITTSRETHWESDNIIVTWAVGHLLELKTPEEYDPALKNWRGSIDKLPFIPEKFEIKPSKGKNSKQLTAIKKLIKSKDCTEIINACDAAREGELIFRRIIENAKIKTPMSRMWLQSMTNNAILDAWENRSPSEDFEPLRDAAYSRAEADWIIGMNGTRVASTFLRTTRNDKSSLSLGRVQTATLAMIVDHEIEILSHSPKPFWELEGTFECDGAKWSARWERKGHKDDKNNPELKAHRIVDEEEKKVLEGVISSPGAFEVSQTNRTSKEKPPLNFDLTGLQREANNLWSWSARRTLSAAQELYATHKLTTYPRTDSRYLPEDMMDEVEKIVRQLGAQKTLNEHSKNLIENGLNNSKRNFNNSKVSDHFAIIPTGKLPSGGMNQDAEKLYDLIARQFLASFHPEATWSVEKRTATKLEQIFIKEVRKLTTPGWRAVRPKSTKIPEGWGELAENPCDAEMISHEFKEEKTKPPNRLKEAGLLRLMEHAGKKIDDEDLSEIMKDKGLGTPATRAETIEKLISREFIARNKGSIRAMPHGIKLIDMLRRIPVQWITSPELTGDMEAKLASVQRGNSTRDDYMDGVTTLVTELVEGIRGHDRNLLYENEDPIGVCPICSESVGETILSYICSKNEGRDKGCSFVMWKDSSGRWFDRETAKKLIEEKSIVDLHGFFSRNGESYGNNVSITEKGTINFANKATETTNADDVELCACPRCNSGTIRIGTNVYSCDNGECQFRGLGKNICKRDISSDEALKILTEGKSELIEDFTSKRGKKFPAYLVLEEKKVGFEFPPREVSPDAKRFEIQPGIIAMCTVHEVGIIETDTHYVPEENNKGCKLNIAREMSKREITRDEVKQLIESKKIGPFDDFVSRKAGKPFSATLYIRGNESIGYRFAKK